MSCAHTPIEKAQAVPELAEIVVLEVALREALLLANRRAAALAVKRAVETVSRRKDRPVDEALAEEVDARINAAFNDQFQADVALILPRLLPPIYRLAKRALWRRIMGDETSPLLYDFPKDVQKAAPPPTLGIDVRFDLADDDAIRALGQSQQFWIGNAYDRILSSRIRDVVREHMILGGHSGREVAPILRDALRKEFGIDAAPTGWRGNTQAYFGMVASSAATWSRSYGSIRSALDLGIKYLVWLTQSDERVCARCAALDGRRFRVDLAFGNLQRALAARTLDELKASSPWLGEAALLDLVRTADATGDPSEYLLSEGIGIPGLHGGCRCSLDVDLETPTFGPDSNPVADEVRDEIGRRMAADVQDVTSTQRESIAEAYGHASPWWKSVNAVFQPVDHANDLAFVSANRLPARILSLLDVVVSGRRIGITRDALDVASSGRFHAANYAMGHYLPKALDVDDAVLATLFASALAYNHTVHPSARASKEEYFAQGYEAYTETAKSDDRVDRAELKILDPALHEVLDRLVQEREKLPIARVPATIGSGLEQYPTASEQTLLDILQAAELTQSKSEFDVVASDFADALSDFSDDAARPWARTFVATGFRREMLP